MVRLLGEPFNEQSGSARKAVPSALILGILRQHIFLARTYTLRLWKCLLYVVLSCNCNAGGTSTLCM
jgi:hypothetical protein